MDGHVIRRIEALAVQIVREDGDLSVLFRAHDVAGGVLTGNQPALQIENVAVRLVTLFAKGFQSALFAPLHQLAVGDVREDQLLFGGQPDWAFGESHSASQFLNLGAGRHERAFGSRYRQIEQQRGCSDDEG